MGRRRWCTPEQQEMLDSQRTLFVRHKDLKVLPAFWTAVHKEWFLRWPNREPHGGDLADAEKNNPQVVTGESEADRKKRMVSNNILPMESF